jgi:hypothetical protein
MLYLQFVVGIGGLGRPFMVVMPSTIFFVGLLAIFAVVDRIVGPSWKIALALGTGSLTIAYALPRAIRANQLFFDLWASAGILILVVSAASMLPFARRRRTTAQSTTSIRIPIAIAIGIVAMVSAAPFAVENRAHAGRLADAGYRSFASNATERRSTESARQP